MILFLEDWLKYPNAIPHKTTRNESWYYMAKVYKTMGIKNHMFLLALINPLLEFINPHSPNLTQEEKDMVLAECKINPWYYFREVARIPAGVGLPAESVKANRGNIAAWWCFFNHITITMIQPRQTGKSYTIYELDVYLMTVLCQGTNMNLFTKDEKLRKDAVDIIKKIFDALPEYIDLRNKRTDANNTEEITVNLLENKLRTFVPRSSEKDAGNVGRGFGSPINHVDEAAFCGNAHISMPALFSAGNAKRDMARRSGAPYCNIVTTTAGKLDSPEGKFVYDNYILSSMPMSEHIYDQQNEKALEEFVKRNAGGNYQISVIMSHRQLGLTDEWLWEQMRETKTFGDAADRDYFNVWTSGTESHPLSPALLKRIVASQNDAYYDQYFPHQKYFIRWNVDEVNLPAYLQRSKLILGVDPSSANNNDDIALVWVDAATLDVVASATVNETNILMFGNWLAVHLVENKNVTLVLETKSTGEALRDMLLSILPSFGEDPYKRIFNTIVQDKDDFPERYEVVRLPVSRRDNTMYTLNKSAFGFCTAASGRFARSDLYGNTLQNAAKRGGDKVFDKRLINQISSLVKKNERVDHLSGKHDDLVVAWLLCHWFLSNGKHMTVYGINDVMTQVGDEKELTYDEYLAAERQKMLRAQINDLGKEMEECADPYLADKLEHQLRLLAQGVIYQQGDLTSIDQMLADIKERKKKRSQTAAVRRDDEAVNDHDFYRKMMGYTNRSFYG
jgi:hypothetical protein